MTYPNLIRPPHVIAERWREKDLAYLNDIAKYNLQMRIDSRYAEDDTRSSITISGNQVHPTSADVRYSNSWRVIDLAGDNPDLSRIADKLINIAGVPNPLPDPPYSV